MANLNSGAHILVIPYPAQGHMIPLVDLTHQLATRALNITILTTPKNLPLLKHLLSTNPSIQTLVLPFPSHPSIPPALENAKDFPPNSTNWRGLSQALAQLHDPLVQWFKSHPSPPVAIISDVFLGWTHHLASHLGIRRVTFSPSGAMALSVMWCLWKEMPKMQTELSFPRVPSCPKYPWWQLSLLYRSHVEGDPLSEFIKDGFLANFSSWGLVVNSFDGIESVYLDFLRKELGHERVWAVGPVLPDEHSGNGPINRGGSVSSSISVRDVLTWLDTCEDGKVVYVCFGSQGVLINEQMEALALALESSGVHFVWCVKQHVEEGYGVIPPGFEDRVAGRGLVITGWAPQVVLLSHRAVGAFLTHCGWNSVLEGLVAGVTMLAWPMSADQFVNASLLVDELKVGIRVCDGANTVPDTAELARVLVDSVSGSRINERVRHISKVAIEAVQGGSSVKDLDGLVKHLGLLEFKATN